MVKIPVPSGLRSHIIGRQGQMIQAMSKRTGAKIQVPKAEEGSRTADEEDDGTTIDIVIEGDAISAESARREIENLVNERTSTVNMRLKDIPAEFYPFIAGPRNAKIDSLTSGKDIQIKVPHYYSWSQQAGPPPSSARNAPPKFTSHPSHHIQISGDRVQVQQARAEIERQVEALRKQIALDELAINRGQHQFIVGNRGETLHDLLEETGCAVILPPDGSDSEMLFVTGPRNKLDAGIDKVMNLATSMQMSNIDIAKQNGNAGQAYARALTSYLQQRRAIQALEEAHSAHIVLPTIADGPMNWEVYAREGKNTIKARSDIINIVNAHPPSRIQHVSVDPFFHSHIRDLHQQRVRKEHGVYLILPEESEHTEKLVIVYGGSELDVPRQRPSSEEIQEFGRILAKVQEEILGIVSGQRPIDIRGVEVPSK